MISNLLQCVDVKSQAKLPLYGGFIYFVTDKNDDIVYIGQTTSLCTRICSHKAKDDYRYLRAIEVAKDVNLSDAEFVFISKYKPKYNRALPTPSFMTTKCNIINDSLENIYDLSSPDVSTIICGRMKNFWIKTEFKNCSIAAAVSKISTDQLEVK